MAAPAEFSGLAALAYATINRPGIDEFARALARLSRLPVALGDVDDLDRKRLREPRPTEPIARHASRTPAITRDVEQRLLDEMRNPARICAMRQHRRRSPRGIQRPGLLAQRIVGTRRGRQCRVGVTAFPGLDAGVKIEGATLRGRIRSGPRSTH